MPDPSAAKLLRDLERLVFGEPDAPCCGPVECPPVQTERLGQMSRPEREDPDA